MFIFPGLGPLDLDEHDLHAAQTWKVPTTTQPEPAFDPHQILEDYGSASVGNLAALASPVSRLFIAKQLFHAAEAVLHEHGNTGQGTCWHCRVAYPCTTVLVFISVLTGQYQPNGYTTHYEGKEPRSDIATIRGAA